MMRRALGRLGRDERGVTIVETAVVLPVFIVLMLGLFDLVHTAAVRGVLQGAMQMAARNSTLESGQTTGSTIDAYVQSQVTPVIGNGGTFTSSRLSYSDFSSVGKAEPYTDTNGNGQYDKGECFYDINGNGTWDSDMGKGGQGAADAAVLYTMTVSYHRMFPMAKLLGWSANQTITAATVLRNQPYGVQTTPTTVCST